MKKPLIPFIAANLALATCLIQPGALLAAPSFNFATSGDSMLDITDFTVATYESNLTIENIGSASRTGDVFSFPIVGGAVDAQSVYLETINLGGMRITNGKAVVTLSDPIVNTTTTQPIMTFLVSVNGSLMGRFAIFTLKVPHYPKPQSPGPGLSFRAPNIMVTLAEEGASTLNSALGTTFATGLNVGSLKVKSVLSTKIPG